MACYGCAKDFSLFNRESACAQCGFGFCSGCVKQRAVLPGQGPKEQKVCGPCYTALKNPAKVARQERSQNVPVPVCLGGKKLFFLFKFFCVEAEC